MYAAITLIGFMFMLNDHPVSFPYLNIVGLIMFTISIHKINHRKRGQLLCRR